MGMLHDHLADDLNRYAESGNKGGRRSPKVIWKTNTAFRAVARALILKWKN